MEKKQLILLGALFVVALILGGVLNAWLGQRRQSKPGINAPRPTVLPSERPRFPTPVVNNIPLYTIDQTPQLPTAVPSYVLSKKDASSLLSRVAAALGFTEQPKIIESTRGQMMLYSKEKKSLSSVGDPQEVSFINNTTSSTKGMRSPGELESSALSFLKGLGLLSPSLQYSVSKTTYFQSGSGGNTQTTKSALATVAQVDFKASLQGVPVYVKDAELPSAWVRFNTNQEPIGFMVYILPEMTEEKGIIPVISAQDAINNLMLGHSVISNILVGSSNAQPVLLKTAPKNISVTDIEVAYYYSSNQTRLLPIYVIRGKGVVETEPVQITALVSGQPSSK